MRHVVAVLLIITFPLWPAAAQTQTEDVFDPPAALTEYTENYEKAANLIALLNEKARLGLFDLRLCEPGTTPPFADAMEKERREILAQAELYSLAIRSKETRNVVNAVAADTFMSQFQADLKDLSTAAGSKAAKPIAETIGVAATLHRGVYENLLTENQQNLQLSREAMQKASKDWITAERAHAKWVDAFNNAAGEKPETRNTIVEWLIKTSNDLVRASTLLTGVRLDHTSNMVIRCDIKRAVAQHEKVEARLQNFEKLAKSLATVSKGVTAFNEKDNVELATLAADQLKELGTWWTASLGKDLESSEKLATAGMKAYTLKRMRRTPIEMNPTECSQLLGKVVKGQQEMELNGEAKQLMEHIGTVQTVFTTVIPYLVMMRQKTTNDQSKVFWETANDLIRKKVATYDEILKTRQELDDDINRNALNAISYFQASAAALEQLGDKLEFSTAQVFLKEAAKMIKQATGMMIDFAKTTKIGWAQGGQLTVDGEFRGRYDERLNLHPALMGLKVRVLPEEDASLIIPSGGQERKISKTEFDRLLLALQTWTSLSGVNPSQEDLFGLGAGDHIGVPGYAFAGDRVVLDETRKRFNLDQATEVSSRRILEQDIGALCRELDFLTRALAGTEGPFRLSDMKNIDTRKRVSELRARHAALNDIYEQAYGGEMSPTLFAAILQDTKAGPRTSDNVSALEKKLLQARNRTLQQGPLYVNWIQAEQTKAKRLEITTGVDVGPLPDGVKVRRRARVTYPDGSTVLGLVQPAKPGRSPLVCTFAVDPIDWAKLSAKPVVNIEVEAEAGDARSSQKQTCRLDPPLTFDSLEAMPKLPEPGLPLRLEACVALAENAATLQGDPHASFTITLPGKPPATVEATDLRYWNGVTLMAEGNYQVPTNLAKDAKIVIDALVEWDGITVKQTRTLSGGESANLQDRTFVGHTSAVWSVAFSPDSRRLASSSWDNTVRIWDTGTGRELSRIDLPGRFIQTLCFSADGTRLVGADSRAPGGVMAWTLGSEGSVESETELLPRRDMSYACTAFSPDGQTLAVGTVTYTGTGFNVSHIGELLLLDGATYQVRKKIPLEAGGIHRLTFSGDGKWIAARMRPKNSSDGAMVTVFDAATGEARNRLAGSYASTWNDTAVFLRNGESVAATWYGYDRPWLYVWDTLATAEPRLIDRVYGPVAAAQDGIHIAASTRFWRTALINARDGALAKPIAFATDPFFSPTSIAFTPQDDAVAAGMGNGLIHLNLVRWGDASPRPLAKLKFKRVRYSFQPRKGLGLIKPDEPRKGYAFALACEWIGENFVDRKSGFFGSTQQEGERAAEGSLSLSGEERSGYGLSLQVDYRFPPTIEIVATPEGEAVSKEPVSISVKASPSGATTMSTLFMFRYLGPGKYGRRWGIDKYSELELLGKDVEGEKPVTRSVAWSGPWLFNDEQGFITHHFTKWEKGRDYGWTPEHLRPVEPDESGKPVANLSVTIAASLPAHVLALWAEYEIVESGGQLCVSPASAGTAGATSPPLQKAAPKTTEPKAEPEPEPETAAPVTGGATGGLPPWKPGAEALFNKGIGFADEGEWAKAEAEYRKAVAADNGHDDLWSCLGEACTEQGKWEEAVKAYREAIRLSPDNSDYQDDLANALEKNGQAAEAAAARKEAKRLKALEGNGEP